MRHILTHGWVHGNIQGIGNFFYLPSSGLPWRRSVFPHKGIVPKNGLNIFKEFEGLYSEIRTHLEKHLEFFSNH